MPAGASPEDVRHWFDLETIAELPDRDGMIGVIGQPGIMDDFYLRSLREREGRGQRIFSSGLESAE